MQGIEAVDIAHAIQLALAPVFMISGIGVLLGVMTNRLARVVDRARIAEEKLRVAAATDVEQLRAGLGALGRRAWHMNVAITFATLAALLISLVVALLFASTFVRLNLATAVAVLFVLAMLSLVGALVSFLLEVRIAIANLHIGPR